MSTIIKDIALCAEEYEMSTGIKPTRLYLGRREMLALGKLIYKNSYQENKGVTAREGKARPEVLGYQIYEVNDDGPHMRACT